MTVLCRCNNLKSLNLQFAIEIQLLAGEKRYTIPKKDILDIRCLKKHERKFKKS